MAKYDREVHDRRIHELRDRIADATGEIPLSGRMPGCPPETEERFLESVLACELGEAEATPVFDQLVARGVALPNPRDMRDREIAEKLHEVFGALAQLGVYVTSTDHLGDRALYETLWTDTLRVPEQLDPDNPNAATMVDLTLGGSEEDTEIWLSYYASESDRLAWQSDYPDRTLPPRKRPVCDRDRTLPVWPLRSKR